MIEPSIVQEMIQRALPEAEVRVLDPQNDKTHLQAIVISDVFVGKNRVQRHKIVYAALGDAFSENLHALALATKTKEEWETQNA